MKYLLLVAFALIVLTTDGQIVNGDLSDCACVDSTCYFNLPNNKFNGQFPSGSPVAWGKGGQVDNNWQNGCGNYPALPKNTAKRFVSLDYGLPNLPDAINFKFSQSFVKGQTYLVSFLYSASSITTPAPITVGISTSATSQGVVVCTAPAPPYGWIIFSYLFTATIDAGYLSFFDGGTEYSRYSGAGIADVQLSQPLPIHLNYLHANCMRDNIRVEWQTACEVNNDYFILEKSRDNQNYLPVYKTYGAGNSSTQNNYSFTDEYPYNGNNYYRLKQVDYDGTITESAPAACFYNGLTVKNVLDSLGVNILDQELRK